MRKSRRDAVRRVHAGTVPFNALTCVEEGDCAEYVNGACVRCHDGLVIDADTGRCVEGDDCVDAQGGACLGAGTR